MDFRVVLQLAEAFGPVNRYYCSEAYQRPVEDLELLLTYYIKSGGAEDFARRYSQAIGQVNRWYCSQFYRRDIRDRETLWEYYVHYAPLGAAGKEPRAEADHRGGMDWAC